MGKQKGPGNPNFQKMIRQGRVTQWKLRNTKIRFDETWRELMREVSEELGWIPYEDVERINSAWWRFVSEMLARPDFVTIWMMYFIKIKPSIKKLYRYCEKIGALIETFHVRESRGLYDKKVGDLEKMEKHLVVLQDSYMRLEQEEIDRKKRRARLRRKRKKEGGEKNPELAKFNAERKRMLATRMVEGRKLKLELEKNKNDGKSFDERSDQEEV